MKRQLDDPVFGILTFDSETADWGSWSKQDHLDLVGGAIRLSIQADSDGPTEEQRQVYLAFKQSEMGLRAELQEALFEFYRVEREMYADVCSDIEGYIETCLPILRTSGEIWEILDPLVWLILGPESWVGQLDESGAKCDTMLFWHGCWDVEHEFGALFKDEKLMSVKGPGNF